MNILELSSGDLHLGVLPELGGALAWLRHGDFDLLRPWDHTPTVRRTACFPLVPYSNRIADGRFRCDTTPYQLPRNFGEHPHSIHGLGWQREWQIVERSISDCRLRLAHNPEEEGGDHWPFAFEVEQWISLNERGVSLSLKMRNDSQQPMPAGLGWHPYFPRHGGVELAFDAAAVWINGSDSLPLESIQVPPKWTFSPRRAVGYVGLDNCFEGWQHRAELYWPQADMNLVMTAPAGLDYLVVFTPPEPQDFIAVEPVSHLNNAINLASPQANGMVWLAPGQSMERCLQMRVMSKASGEVA